jgi:2-amino-4-hydroxy-6-hydroxymethyldihydropteridine diphosphokinase
LKDILIGLGANEGDPLDQLRTAVDEIARELSLASVSSVYLTEPVGALPQPDYFNLACLGHTGMPVRALHRRLLAIETRMGRVRNGVRDTPRPIDIDLLAYGTERITEPDLVVPHPRLHERAFVLVPLHEIVPAWRHPILDKTPAEMLDALADRKRVRRWGHLARRSDAHHEKPRSS